MVSLMKSPVSISKFLGALLLGGALFSTSASAAVLLERLPDASPTGQQTDGNTPSYQETVNFAGQVLINKISWWGYDVVGDPAALNNFAVTLAGVTQSGAITETDTGLFPGTSVSLMLYEMNLGSVSFAGGTLDLINDSQDVEWYWQGSGADPQTGAGLRALRIEGTRQQNVPEPEILWLLGVGGIGLALARRRPARRS